MTPADPARGGEGGGQVLPPVVRAQPKASLGPKAGLAGEGEAEPLPPHSTSRNAAPATPAIIMGQGAALRWTGQGLSPEWA